MQKPFRNGAETASVYHDYHVFAGILGGFQENLARHGGKRQAQMRFNGCEYRFLLRFVQIFAVEEAGDVGQGLVEYRNLLRLQRA